jgi:hypothetical protein
MCPMSRVEYCYWSWFLKLGESDTFTDFLVQRLSNTRTKEEETSVLNTYNHLKLLVHQEVMIKIVYKCNFI